eukprot:897498-Alexandrium_andersonii.AAC.1
MRRTPRGPLGGGKGGGAPPRAVCTRRPAPSRGAAALRAGAVEAPPVDAARPEGAAQGGRRGATCSNQVVPPVPCTYAQMTPPSTPTMPNLLMKSTPPRPRCPGGGRRPGGAGTNVHEMGQP